MELIIIAKIQLTTTNLSAMVPSSVSLLSSLVVFFFFKLNARYGQKSLKVNRSGQGGQQSQVTKYSVTLCRHRFAVLLAQ